MSGFKNNLKKTAKRTSAIILAALLTAGCTETAMLSMTAKAASAPILSNEDRGVIFANSRTDFRDESIYFLITTRFYDGDPSNNTRTSEDDHAKNPENDPSWRGDFKGLIDKLDYIKALGFTAIWITPVVENDSGYDYHGYHAYDFSAVDTRYESNGVTYQDLIDACHAKGMKVIQDVVLNHTCNWGEKNLLKIDNPEYSGGRSNYVMPSGASLDPENIYHHNGFCGGGDWDNYEAQRKTIADDCFDLETENPKVYNYLIDCYTKYINMGVDGFRVDTVKHISRLTFNSTFLPAFKKAGGDNFYMFGEVCTKGHDVWYRDCPPISTPFYTWADDSSWTGRWSTDTASNEALVEEHYEANMNKGNQPTSTNAFLKGNDYHTPDYSEKSGLDVIDFQMHWSFINANNAFNTALGEDKYFNDSTWNVVYVDSHDYAPDECQTQRYTGGTDAWAENLSLMFTFRGIPCIYYGSEIEFQKGMPIDVGPNAKLSETGRAYYGDHIEGTVDTSDFTVFGNLSGEVENTLNSKLSQHIMRLNRIRQAVPALRKGQYSTEGCSGNIAFKRRYTDSTTDSFACVAISGSATFSGIPNGTYKDAVTGDIQNVTNGTLRANVSGKGNMKVYVLDTAKTPAPGRVIPNGDYLTDGGASEKIGPVEVKPEKVVEDTGITLDKTQVTVLEGNSVTVNATVQPSNATYKSVTWSSDKESVATVSGGRITGVSAGSAVITAKTKNGHTAKVNVTVKTNPDIVKPTGIKLSPTSLDLEMGDTGEITATVSPSTATDKSVTWGSDDTAVATVSNGKVKAVSVGSATITATTSNGLKATCSVTVSPRSVKVIENGVYFEKPDNWGNNINIYLYDSSTDSTVGENWPGTAMTDSGDGKVYVYEYTNSNPNLMIVFNDGSNQAPGDKGFEYKNLGYYTSSGYQYTVKPAEALTNNSTLSSTSITLGNSITINGKASGGTSPYTYKFESKHSTSSNYHVIKDFSSTATTSWQPGKTGTYTIRITVKDKAGKTASKTFTLTVKSELQNNSKLSATSIKLGSSVKVTGSATGGTAPYTYSYYYRKTTTPSWTAKAENTTSTSVTITPGAATSYEIKVVVKDSTGNSSTRIYSLTVTK